MKELPKVYDPNQVEKKIYDMWMRGGYFAGKADPDKKPFSIVNFARHLAASHHVCTGCTYGACTYDSNF